MDIEIILIITIVAIGLVIYLNKKNAFSNSNGKIPSKYAKFDDIVKHIQEFKPIRNENLKEGYTEKSIENQLYKYLQQIYVSVTPQYGIEGKNGRNIDLDVADGVAGVEIKIASKLFKSAEHDRLNGQLRSYLKARYKENNLILLVCGTKEDSCNTILHEVKETCRELSVKYIFSEI